MCNSPQAPAPDRLTVNDLTDPVAIESAPRFGWWLAGATIQSGYQIQVHRGSAVRWDSGRVEDAGQSHVPYRGTSLSPGQQYEWRVRVTDPGGRTSPWSAPGRFGAGITDRDWQAAWIRRRGYDREDEHALARREVRVPDRPITRAVAYLAAYHSCLLRLDGRIVASGPAFAYPDDGYYLAADVTESVRPGALLAIGCHLHTYGPGKGRPDAEPGLLLQLAVDFAGGERWLAVTDESWRVCRGPWLPAPWRNHNSRDYVERIDGRDDPVGWDQPGFDDRHWDAPQVLGVHPVAPFPRLSAQETELVRTRVEPVERRELPRAVVFDFGQVIPAVPVVRFRHGTTGHLVPMRAGYLCDGNGAVAKVDGAQNADMSLEYLQRDGDQVFRPRTYLGFRYLQVDHAGERLPATAVHAVAQHTAVDLARTAQLSCSEPMLDRVVELCLRSARYASQEQFVDTPTREKGQFLGDAVNISQAMMIGYGERALTRQAIGEFIASQRRFWPDGRLNAVYPTGEVFLGGGIAPYGAAGGYAKRDIPDFTLLFPGWVWDYYLESADATTLARGYPVAQAVCGYAIRHRSGTTGLVTNLAGGTGPYRGGLVDNTMWHEYDLAVAARTTVNILAVDALARTADAADALGRPDREIQELRATAAGLREAVHLQLFADGRYLDGLYGDGKPSSHASQLANAYALAYRIVPAEVLGGVAEHVAQLGMRMGPMNAHRLVRALHLAARYDDAVTALTDPERPGWANILARGGTFTWESWDAPEHHERSLSHGWGATVLVPILQDLLGVRVTEPGAAAVMIAPPPAGLRHCRGRVPTQRGEVAVNWWREEGGTCLDVAIPAGQHAMLRLPGADGQRVGPGNWSFRPGRPPVRHSREP